MYEWEVKGALDGQGGGECRSINARAAGVMDGERMVFQPGNKFGRRFEKGMIPKNKGRSPSDETREKMRQAWVGRVVSQETRAKMSKAFKGRVFTEEHRRNLSLANQRRTVWPAGKKAEKIKKTCPVCMADFEVIPARTDKTFCNRQCAVIGRDKGYSDKRGEKNGHWNGGVTSLRQTIYSSKEYHKWRGSIFSRDKKTCQACYSTTNPLQVHHTPHEFAEILRDFHIKTFEDALACEILWDVNNGQVLCVNCHRKTYRGNILREEITYSSL